MTPARLWLSLFLAGFLVCAGLLVQTLLTMPPYGDLTRIGRISDREFGWTAQQPNADKELLRAVPVAAADILVIGDSFSNTYRWQAALTKQGYSVSTIFWGDLNEALCSDFSEWLKTAGFAGKLVIVESVERVLAMRLAHSEKCSRTKAMPTVRPTPPWAPTEAVPAFDLNWKAKISSGWMTARCTKAALAGRRGSGCNKDVTALPVPEGCKLFSNQHCDKTLLLTGDKTLGELEPQHATAMRAFNNAHPAVPILWMVIPNKWTTYIEPTHSQSFVRAMRDAQLGPDLFQFTQEAKGLMLDFYLPNDTHMSLQGQDALGDRMREAVVQKLGDCCVSRKSIESAHRVPDR